MSFRLRQQIPVITVSIWLLVVVSGMAYLIDYETRAGDAGNVPVHWPAESTLELRSGQPQLLMFVHPRCPCSRASIEELSRVMTYCGEAVSVRFVLRLPSQSDESWTSTDLVTSARRIPGAEVVLDTDGIESKRFGVSTSGHTLLYTEDGSLAFSGGITGSRGHAGDNAGSSKIFCLLCPAFTETPHNSAITTVPAAKGQKDTTCVFGCPLFHSETAPIEDESRHK